MFPYGKLKTCCLYAVQNRGAFHYAKHSGNFGPKSNGKVLSTFSIWSDRNIDLNRSERSDRKFVPFWQIGSLPYYSSVSSVLFSRFSLSGGLGKRVENGKRLFFSVGQV